MILIREDSVLRTTLKQYFACAEVGTKNITKMAKKGKKEKETKKETKETDIEVKKETANENKKEPTLEQKMEKEEKEGKRLEEVCENLVKEGNFDATMAIESASIRAVEWQHQKDLQTLEEAIARKRNQLRSKIEMDHMKEKAKLDGRIQQLEHEILAQQHKFRSNKDKKEKEVAKYTEEFNNDQEVHEMDLDRVAQGERNKTLDILNKIAMTRTERERIVPQIGKLDGQLQTVYEAGKGENDDATRIPRALADDLRDKIEETEAFYMKEDQRLEADAREQIDVLMDEINNLDQELQDERRHIDEAQATQATRLNELRLQIQKGSRGPIQFDEEKAKLIDEVSDLKEQWRGLRGNEEEQLESTVQFTEKKRIEGREKLLRQRAHYFVERQNMTQGLNDIMAKIYDKQKQIDNAKKMFQDRVEVKQKELEDAEQLHAERMAEKSERREKRLQELEHLEQEREKRRQLELSLLATKEDKLREGFAVKKNHILNAIKEAEQRVRDVLEELNTPQKKDTAAIGEIQSRLGEVQQKRVFIEDLTNFAKSISNKEIDLMNDEGENLKRNYAEQMAQKQRELQELQNAHAKQRKDLERQAALGEQRFAKSTAKLINATSKMQEYIENLSNEISRLESERQLLADEYASQQEGIRHAMVKDEENIQKERIKMHEQLEHEREQFAKSLENLNAKMVTARAQKDDMAQKFKRDINQFTLKAMGSGPSGQNQAHVLAGLMEKIQAYTTKIQAMNDKIHLLKNDQAADKAAKTKDKRNKILNLQAQNDGLMKKLQEKQKLVKEGNKMLQLFANEDDCLYCRLSNQTKGRKEELSSIYNENRRLTDKLTNLFQKENEYERLSAKELAQLRSAFEATLTQEDSMTKEGSASASASATEHRQRKQDHHRTRASSTCSTANI